MAQYIDKSALVAEIEKCYNECLTRAKITDSDYWNAKADAYRNVLTILDNLEVKEVDIDKEIGNFFGDDDWKASAFEEEQRDMIKFAKHFFELGIKAQHDNWKVVDNTNLPQTDRTKMYCVFTKQHYILATVINHPQDEDLLQWKCTDFPFRRYDMCEGDKYMQII